MPPAAVPGVTSTKLYACYSKASAYDRPWRQAADVLAVRLRRGLFDACEECFHMWLGTTLVVVLDDWGCQLSRLCMCLPETCSTGSEQRR